MAQSATQRGERSATRGYQKKARVRQQQATQRREEPDVPLVMLIVTLTKDFAIDPLIFMLSMPPITPLGWAIGAFVGGLFYLTLWLWFLFRGADLYTRRMQVYLFIAFFTSIVPIARLVIPEYTLVVWFQYRDERRRARENAES
jgi:hypothetical protein